MKSARYWSYWLQSRGKIHSYFAWLNDLNLTNSDIRFLSSIYSSATPLWSAVHKFYNALKVDLDIFKIEPLIRGAISIWNETFESSAIKYRARWTAQRNVTARRRWSHAHRLASLCQPSGRFRRLRRAFECSPRIGRRTCLGSQDRWQPAKRPHDGEKRMLTRFLRDAVSAKNAKVSRVHFRYLQSWDKLNRGVISTPTEPVNY